MSESPFPPAAQALLDAADWQDQRARAMRYINAGGLVALVTGVLFSLAGLLAGALMWRLRGDLVVAGLATVSGVVAGLVASRRGRKALNADPLLVVGAVLRKGQVPAKKGRLRLALVVRVDAAWRLDPESGPQPRADLCGERTIFARDPVYQQVTPDPDRLAGLVCLPSGEALFLSGGARSGGARTDAP